MKSFKKIPNRSDSYQPALLEIAYPHELLDIFSDHDSIYKKLNPFAYNDDIAELQEQLTKELWRIIEDNLTERQKQVVKLYASGKTQIEIAKQLGVNQSSVTKCLAGETKISFVHGSKSIREIWEDCHWYDKLSLYHNPSHSILCFNETSNNTLVTTTIKAVTMNEEKPLLSVITQLGMFIRATADHLFYTPEGWVELGRIVEENKQLTVVLDNQIRHDSVFDCQDGGTEKTYDIEVEGPYHNFIANNIVLHNCVYGNVDYKNRDSKGKPITYGGVKLKLQKIVKEDKIVNEILAKIADLRENDPF